VVTAEENTLSNPANSATSGQNLRVFLIRSCRQTKILTISGKTDNQNDFRCLSMHLVIY